MMTPMPRRLLLWVIPFVVVVAGLLALGCAEEQARLADARALLVEGDAEAARGLLSDLAGSPLAGPRARAGLRIAAALGAALPADPDLGLADLADLAELDASPFPLRLITRRAFERGELEAALELIDLADELDRPTDPLVRAAVLIETAPTDEKNPPVALPASTNELAERIRDHLATARGDASLILRDRRGERLGYLSPEGELELVPGVEPATVPRSVADLVRGRVRTSARLTLDRELSEIALAALGRFRGSIVLADPQNGEILAAVSDRRTFKKGGTPSFEQRREPASIAKLITTAATLRAGLDPDAKIAGMRCRGHEKYAGEFLYCPYIAGPLKGLDRALAVSCNVAFASLGVEVGRARMLEEMRRWGFGTPFREAILGELPAGEVIEPWGDERQLADLSIGLEASEITPLHAAFLAAAIANQGAMPEPALLLAEDGRLGLHPRPFSRPAPRRVFDAAWTPIFWSAMQAVVERGTARAIAPPGFPVAMKTGTASDPRWGFHVNYIGFGPLPAPRLAFAVRITNQGTSRQVRYVARVVTRRLLRALERVAAERGWGEERPPQESPASPERQRFLASREAGEASGAPVAPTRAR